MTIGLLFLLTLLRFFLPGHVHADGVSVRLEPASSVIRVGETVIIEVVIEDVEELFGADIRLRFDPTLVEVMDAKDKQSGIQVKPGSFPYPDFAAINEADNDTGEISYVVTQLSPREPLSGTGVAYSVEFKAKAVGTCLLDIHYGVLVRMDGVSFEAALVGAMIQVNSASGETPYPMPPTDVPTPTASPTPRPTFTPTAVGVVRMTSTWTPKPVLTSRPSVTGTPIDAAIPGGAYPGPTTADSLDTPAPGSTRSSASPTPLAEGATTVERPVQPGATAATATPVVATATSVVPPLVVEGEATLSPDRVETLFVERTPDATPTPHSFRLVVPTVVKSPTPKQPNAIARAGRQVLRCLWGPLLLGIIGLGFYLRLKDRFPERRS